MNVILGNEKEVEIRPWKAKDKKAFIKLLEDKGENVTGEDITNVLVRSCMSDPEIFLNPDEAQYLIMKIKEISIGNNISFDMDCDNPDCGKNFDVNITFDDITHYQPSKFPHQGKVISWREIPSQKIFDDVIKSTDEAYMDVEMVLHMDSINGQPIASFQEALEIVDEMELKQTEEIEQEYSEVVAFLELGTKIKCPHCGYEDDYQFDIIPHFFDELLPN